MEYTPVTADDFAAIDDLPDWELLDGGVIRATFAMPTFPAGASLISAISGMAEHAAHHPDLTLNYPGKVGVELTTHDAGGLTTLDTDLARQITRVAKEMGAT